MANVVSNSKPEIQESNSLIKLYPNPANGKVTFSNGSTYTERLIIYDVFGHLVDHFELRSNSEVVLHLSEGLYLVNINNQETRKLVINNE